MAIGAPLFQFRRHKAPRSPRLALAACDRRADFSRPRGARFTDSARQRTDRPRARKGDVRAYKTSESNYTIRKVVLPKRYHRCTSGIYDYRPAREPSHHLHRSQGLSNSPIVLNTTAVVGATCAISQCDLRGDFLDRPLPQTPSRGSGAVTIPEGDSKSGSPSGRVRAEDWYGERHRPALGYRFDDGSERPLHLLRRALARVYRTGAATGAGLRLARGSPPRRPARDDQGAARSSRRAKTLPAGVQAAADRRRVPVGSRRRRSPSR